MLNPVYQMVKEVREVDDSKEAALMLQEGSWIAISAVIQDNKIVWIMGRTC